MSGQIVIHPSTERQFKNFLARPSHALLLNAPAGSGKTALALWLVGQITDLPMTNHPYLQIISPDGKSISIDQIRTLNQFLKLKTSGQTRLRRFVIVEQAETLTIQAQNAFLKLLEEPPADTLIILAVNNPQTLLPTVLSRTQIINIARPNKAQLEAVFMNDDFQKLYNLSAGRPGLLGAMLNEEQHPLVEAVEQAKKLLGLSKFEQLSKADELVKLKGDYLIIEALQLIADAGLAQAAGQQNAVALRRWQQILSVTFKTKTALQASAQPKLALTNLMLNL